MPLTIEGARIPDPRNEQMGTPRLLAQDRCAGERTIRIALINNMPDPALVDTESQFFELIEAAAADVPVRVTLYSLPGIARTGMAEMRIRSFYHPIEDLWNSHSDAVIMTGTEPHQPELRREPYWASLVQVLDWAAENSASIVLSCLAAHASVLHSDGITRHRLDDKRFGVFECGEVRGHALTNRIPDRMRFPHSRWNEVREQDLLSCGYAVLAKSEQGGVDLFAKKKGRSLFVHLQGHPEYGALTLLKEYRRDIKRFLKNERETYPSMPQGYFGEAATRLLNDFRENALLDPRERQIDSFPEAAASSRLERSWASSATRVYRNWLTYVTARRNQASRSIRVRLPLQIEGRRRRATVAL
jgi:homoserine O-succinyltransferase